MTSKRAAASNATRMAWCKFHLTETCEPDTPNLVTNVVTAAATLPDGRLAAVVQAGLTERDLLSNHSVALHGPLKR